jgi:putative drug exporter of the RND superfamily
MFANFARFIARYWVAVLVAWVVVPLGLWWVAPSWDKITHDGDFAYLPARMTSVRGTELLERDFPELPSKSSVVLVFARSDGELTDEDQATALRLKDMFSPKPGENPVMSVATFDDPFIGSKLRSANGRSVLVLLQLKTELMAVENMPFIKEIYGKVREVQAEPQFPKGLELGVTGSAAVGADMLLSMKESIEHTELATILLVTIILLVVYRSPGLVLVPLATIGVSFVTALHLIALVAQWADRHQDVLGWVGRWLGRQEFEFQVFTTTHIFIVVVLFGAATDYCLFLIARYREELERGLAPREALEEALGQTGHALTASAMTTILGLGAMIFADFGKYRSGGPTIAISLVVAIVACMTVAPALLRAFGRAVFWPFGAGAQVAVQADPVPRTMMGRFWARLATGIVSHPGLILLGSFLVLAFPAWHGFDVPITYDMLAELNPQRESVQGTRLLEKNFLIGMTGPITILARRAGGNFEANDELARIEALTAELSSFVYVDSGGRETKPIHEVSSLTNPLGEPLTRKKMNLWREKGLGFREMGERIAILKKSRRFYLSGGEYTGEATRFELIGDYDPFSQESMRLLGAIDHWLDEKKSQPNSPWSNVEFDFVGVTAGIRDLDAVNQSDTLLVGVYVAGAVLIILIFLLCGPLLALYLIVTVGFLQWATRGNSPLVAGLLLSLYLIFSVFFLPRVTRGVAGRLLVSIYLIFTVVFGYLVSLGLTQLFFSWLYGSSYQGLDWKLKIFLFVILVAVGEDYNIYLVTRVFEEQRRRGKLDGLHEAVVRTGGIITSCGVIMAGTFGSMITGTLRSMIELGFAMSLGVLLDTFIIRTILVPAFLALMARWGGSPAQEVRGDVASPHFAAASSPGLHGSKKKSV